MDSSDALLLESLQADSVLDEAILDGKARPPLAHDLASRRRRILKLSTTKPTSICRWMTRSSEREYSPPPDPPISRPPTESGQRWKGIAVSSHETEKVPS